MSWLVKVARGGGESVLGSFRTAADAEFKKNELNRRYQTDEYYVEEFDPNKADWLS